MKQKKKRIYNSVFILLKMQLKSTDNTSNSVKISQIPSVGMFNYILLSL